MFGTLSNLWNAVGNLAASLNGLAGTMQEANGRLRQSLALSPPEPAAVEDKTDKAAEADAPAEVPTAGRAARNGRAKATA